MARHCYVPKTFGASSMRVIEQANAIVVEYQKQGFDLTLRQLYYQFVSRDLLPNTVQSYKRLGGIISDARLAGYIDWEAITDRTRSSESNPHWDSPADVVEAAARSYGRDLWADQPSRVEVWIEKEALAGVIEGVCRKWDVRWFPCRGYVSQSEMFVAAQRLIGYESDDQKPVIVHLGDHDPSGIDMSRDIEARLRLLTEGADVDVRRIALNMDQVKRYRCPPNPAKLTDSRVGPYLAEHGESSWELDALEPKVITALIEREVLDVLDRDLFEAAQKEQERERGQLLTLSKRWPEVAKFLDK